MNRVIKFRAWDKELKTMYSWEAMLAIFELGDLNKNTTSALSQNAGIVFMQFTGLKDKNGKEIFESDIIKTPRDIFEVIYKDCEFGRETTNGIVSLVTVRNYEGEELEIIGNIYENPEILK